MCQNENQFKKSFILIWFTCDKKTNNFVNYVNKKIKISFTFNKMKTSFPVLMTKNYKEELSSNPKMMDYFEQKSVSSFALKTN